MDVSIIIVNYNTSKLLEECISSVLTKTKNLEFEIIVVDNSSVDDSVNVMRTRFPKVKLIESKDNLGFGRANNVGATIAKGKYLFFLNTDTLLINNAIKILFDFMEKEENQDVGACGGNLFKKDLSPNFSYSLHFPSLWSHFCYRGHLSSFVNNENFNETGMVKDVAIIIGADLFVRRNLFEKIGGFDPNFFMYVEDTDLLYRIKQNKYRTVSHPDAKIIHIQGASSVNIFKLETEISSYILYFRKHSNSITLKIYLIIELFFLLAKSIILLISNRKGDGLEYFSLARHLFKLKSF